MPPTTIRLDEDVKDGIEALAKADDRSLSAYINRVLRHHLDMSRERTGGKLKGGK